MISPHQSYPKPPKQKFHWLRCPECKKRISLIKSIYLSSNINPMMKIQCDCLQNIYNISIKDYLNTTFNVINCTNHPNEEGRYFCVKCCSWLCQECDINHTIKNPGHIKYISKDLITENCKETNHMQSDLTHYCNDCNGAICKKCISEDKHENHKVSELLKYWSETKETLKYDSKEKLNDFFNEQIKNLEAQKNQHLSSINQLMFLLEKCKADIENTYQSVLRMNRTLIDLIDIVYWDFFASQKIPNINIIKNIQFINLNIKQFNTEPINLKKEIMIIEGIVDDICKVNSSLYTKSFLSYENELEIASTKGLYRRANKRNQIIRIKYNINFYNNCIAVLKAHSNSVTSVIQLSNGRIASSSSDNTIKIWTLSTNQSICTLTGHSNTVWSIFQLHDGRLASSSDDKRIKIWNLVSEKFEYDLLGHEDSVLVITQLINNQLASGSSDQTIKLWDIQLKQCLLTLTGHSHNIFSLIQLHNGCIASGSYDYTIKLWSLEEMGCITTFKGHKSYCRSIIQLFNEYLASASADRTIKLWDINQEDCLQTLIGHTSSVIVLLQLKNGNLVSGSYDHQIMIWDLETCQCVSTLEGHNNAVWALLQLFDGKLVSASWDKTMRIWE